MIVLTLAALALQAPNCADPQNQVESNFCSGIDFERADEELNRVYQRAIAAERESDREWDRINRELGRTASVSRGGEEILRRAQRAWVIFREQHCTFEGYEALGGSAQPLISNSCGTRLTRERIAQLRQPECDTTSGSQPDLNHCASQEFARADDALNRQWALALSSEQRQDRAFADPSSESSHEARLRTAQRAWIEFRDAHCDAAHPSVIGAELDYTLNIHCRTELTRQRTQQLEAMVLP